MKLNQHGKSISTVELQSINQHGIWLFAENKEYFLAFSEYPWFKNAPIKDITNMEINFGHHIHWPQLDIDIDLKSVNCIEQFPLKFS